MYETSYNSIPRRVMRVMRQRGWIGKGGTGMVLPIVMLVLAALAAIWLVGAVAGLAFALIPWAIVGLLTGWAASKLTGSRMGTGWTMLTGIAGSWLGGAIFAGLLGVRTGGLFNPVNLIASVLGAAILITVARVVARPSLTGEVRPRLGRF